jgi:hypothetical protein
MGATAVIAGLQVVQSVGQARAEYAQSQYQKTMANINARNAELQRRRALELGDKNALQYLKRGNSLIGAQKVSYAASGVDIGFGSALEVFKQTKEMSYQDAEEVRSNAFLESLGYQSQSQAYQNEAIMADYMGRDKAVQTILTGGMRAYNTMNPSIK